MKTEKSVDCRRLSALALLFALVVAHAAMAQWPQWGGPNRDFTVQTKGLAESWPEDGPPRLWHRELGDGYSSIVVDDGMLFTMYRKDPTSKEEITVALDVKSGKTIWEHKIPSPLCDPLEEWGYSPNSTPLVVGDRLYAIGTNAVMHCFNKRSGKVLWKHDLAGEFGAPFPWRSGYSRSPIAYKGTVIVTAGRRRADNQEGSGEAADAASENKENPAGQSLIAFDQENGRVAWKGQKFEVGYSSPILINFDGEDQLVIVTSRELIGADPNNGELLWSYTFPREGGDVMTPMWLGDGRLFCSSGSDSVGSRTIQLTKKDGRTVPEELWQTRKIRFTQANPVRVGDCIVGSSGHNPAFVVGVDVETGKRMWIERGFEQAAYVQGDGKIIFLDWNGRLALATGTCEGLRVHSQCKITKRYSLTVPTLVDTTLYVRDREHIMALDIGRGINRDGEI